MVTDSGFSNRFAHANYFARLAKDARSDISSENIEFHVVSLDSVKCQSKPRVDGKIVKNTWNR